MTTLLRGAVLGRFLAIVPSIQNGPQTNKRDGPLQGAQARLWRLDQYGQARALAGGAAQVDRAPLSAADHIPDLSIGLLQSLVLKPALNTPALRDVTRYTGFALGLGEQRQRFVQLSKPI